MDLFGSLIHRLESKKEKKKIKRRKKEKDQKRRRIPAIARAPLSSRARARRSANRGPPYLRLIDFLYHSTLGLRGIKKKRRAEAHQS